MYIVQALIADHQAPTLVVAFGTVRPHQAGAALEELVAEGELGSRGQQLPLVDDAEPVIADVGQFGFETPLIGAFERNLQFPAAHEPRFRAVIQNREGQAPGRRWNVSAGTPGRCHDIRGASLRPIRPVLQIDPCS
jgi:hypothetical protein